MLTLVAAIASAQAPNSAPKPGEPTDPKARKTFAEALEWEKKGQTAFALDAFRKANKQDGGHCMACFDRAYLTADRIAAYKDAEQIAREWLLVAPEGEKASIHWGIANALQNQGLNSKKDKFFEESCEEYKAALQLRPDFITARYRLGISLAYLHRDDEARQEFTAFLDHDRRSPEFHDRAERFVERVELARAKMAPPFSAVTLDGQHISMDSLAGKVVLIDFWATWCGPCREALPRIQSIAKKFEGQPLVVLSVSLDSDDTKWKAFVEKNGMNWLQTRDGGFGGKISNLFGVKAIPATFTIDADGVLEDQHVGDASIEGKLKKLVAQTAKAKQAAASGAGN
jgi:thiol-disulfide isomerase/thioredoxin